METEHLVLGKDLRALKTKPIHLTFSQRTSHARLLNELADHLGVKPHRWVAETHERVTRQLFSQPRDIHINGAHYLTWKALEVLRNLWDETGSEGPRETIRIVMEGAPGFLRRVAKKNPQLADRAGIHSHS